MISLYHQTQNTDEKNLWINSDVSPINASHNFYMQLRTDNAPAYYQELPVKEIVGITESLPTIKMSTSLKNAPIAQISDKIDSFMSNKYIKYFATRSPEYEPILSTDGWTQKFPDGGSTISVDLSFKSYPIDMFLNTTAYSNIIQFLLLLSTPLEYQPSANLDLISQATSTANSYGKTFGQRIKDLNETFNNSEIQLDSIAKAYLNKTSEQQLTGVNKRALGHLKSLIKDIENIGKLNKTENGGTPTFNFQLGTLIKPTVPWILKSWSFKPAIQTYYDIDETATDPNSGTYVPLYVEFKISIETQYILTNKDLIDML